MFGGSVALGYHVYLCGRANLHGRIIGGGSCCLRLVVASAAGESVRIMAVTRSNVVIRFIKFDFLSF